MHPKKLILIAISILASSTISCSTSAQNTAIEENELSNLEFLLDQSKMVFIGQVVGVDYRMSETSSEEEVSLPHTIVTYEIYKTLHGEALGEFFSMRFPGGSDGRGRFMSVSGVPLFQVGDEDLLFVSGNGEDGCPLVLCEWGRYRILVGDTYNTRGVPVQSIDKNQVIARGMPIQDFRSFSYPSPTFDELLENKEVQDLVQMMINAGQSVDDLRRRYEEDAPEQIHVLMHSDEDSTRDALADTGTHNTADDPGWPMAIEQFIAGVSSIAKSTNRAALDPLIGIEPDAPFSATMTSEPVPPPAPQAGKVLPSGAQSPAEAAELEALRNQNFNPVIK